MDTQTFIENIADQYDDLNSEELSTETEFRKVEGYSSIVALSIIMMIDEEYGVTITGDEMKACRTIGNLFNLVNSKR